MCVTIAAACLVATVRLLEVACRLSSQPFRIRVRGAPVLPGAGEIEHGSGLGTGLTGDVPTGEGVGTAVGYDTGSVNFQTARGNPKDKGTGFYDRCAARPTSAPVLFTAGMRKAQAKIARSWASLPLD